jgi:hypothetical protein
MINPQEIKLKAEKKYYSVLQSWLEGNPFTRLEIHGNKSYTKSSLPEFEKEILKIRSQSKEKKGSGYTLEYQIVKTKYLGTQDLPIAIYFETEADLFKYLGKEKEVAQFKIDVQKVIDSFPELKDWAANNVVKVIQSSHAWDGLIQVCHYFKKHPNPNLYIRELPINVHTKFVERNQSIIKDLLHVLISGYLNPNESKFEKRFNLKYSEPSIRFKILDKAISNNFFSGIDDLSIMLSQFENLDLPIKKVIVVENKTTLYTTLTLPKMENTIAIFGSGYSVHNLQNVEWLSNVELLYWGDVDVQGFEILSQFRGYFPHTQSILMDKATFEKFFENDLGTVTKISTQLNLTAAESDLYTLLKTNNWRLEQEKIPFEYVNGVFESY